MSLRTSRTERIWMFTVLRLCFLRIRIFQLWKEIRVWSESRSVKRLLVRGRIGSLRIACRWFRFMSTRITLGIVFERFLKVRWWKCTKKMLWNWTRNLIKCRCWLRKLLRIIELMWLRVYKDCNISRVLRCQQNLKLTCQLLYRIRIVSVF